VQRLLAAVGASTIAEAARALSVDGETVRVWSKAGRIPDSKLRLIALQTGCRISWLRDGEGPQYDRNPGLVVSEPVSTYDALSPRTARWTRPRSPRSSKQALYLRNRPPPDRAGAAANGEELPHAIDRVVCALGCACLR